MNQNIPLNLYTVNRPLLGTVIESRRLTPDSRGPKNDVRHITFRFEEKLPYLPGQSAGIIVPGTDSRTGKPHKLRLYSIASVGAGDLGDHQTVSLCVVRHFWDNAATGEKGIPGLASSYLCDLKPKDQATMTGPVGRHFLLPEDFKKRDLIFTATGTGIAPYRGMLRELFETGYEGHVALYFGVQYRDVALYDDEFGAIQKRHPNFSYYKAISREETNPNPNEVPTRDNKMYVQALMYVHRDELKKSFEKPDTMIYLCGLKGMEAGIFPVLEQIGAELGEKESFVAKLKSRQQLRIEVY